MSNSDVSLTCAIARQDDKEVTISVDAVNRSGHELHIINSDRMPYLMRESERKVLALYGVNAPDPDMDYYGVDIPLTRPLGPGDHFTHEFRLIPLVLRDHFGFETKETPIHGTIELVCRLAYGRTPIDKARQSNMAINALMEWQEWTEAPALRITIP